MDPDDWGHFLTEAFDEWVTCDLGRVQVNLFETAVVQTMGLPSQLCITAPFCGKALAIEKNGDVYSCDHYVYPEYKLGNIKAHKLAHMVFSERQKVFGMGKKETLPAYCKSCPLGRMPEKPHRARPGRRRRAQLFVSWLSPFLRDG